MQPSSSARLLIVQPYLWQAVYLGIGRIWNVDTVREKEDSFIRNVNISSCLGNHNNRMTQKNKAINLED